MPDRYRVSNDRGGHDLTAAGWREMARMQAELSNLTTQVADVIEVQGRGSRAFRDAHASWTAQQRKMMSFVGTGELFEVVAIPRKGRN